MSRAAHGSAERGAGGKRERREGGSLEGMEGEGWGAGKRVWLPTGSTCCRSFASIARQRIRYHDTVTEGGRNSGQRFWHRRCSTSSVLSHHGAAKSDEFAVHQPRAHQEPRNGLPSVTPGDTPFRFGKIKCEKPHFHSGLYQAHRGLSLISPSTDYAMYGTGVGQGATIVSA
eukprot:3308966-Rhodomonas_salina.2